MVLPRWGPWQDAPGLLARVGDLSGAAIALWGDVRSGGLGALQVGVPRLSVDLSSPEGASLALTIVACRALPRASAAALFGEDRFGRRIWFYHHVRDGLGPAARAFWDAHERAVRLGLVAAGASEHRLAGVRRVWTLGAGPTRRRAQARALAWAWGGRARIDPARLDAPDAWMQALRIARPPGLTSAQHAAAQEGVCVDGPVPSDVVWLGDRLDRDAAVGWQGLAPVAVGWSARAEPPDPPAGWQAEAVQVPGDSPLARHGFVWRRNPRG